MRSRKDLARSTAVVCFVKRDLRIVRIWEDGAVVVGRGEDWAVWRLLIGRRRQWLGKRTSRGAWAEDNILAGLGLK